MNAKRTSFTALVALVLLGAAAVAQPYPHKFIRMVVPFPPGGPIDVMARLVGQQMSATLGQQVVIDNRPSAGGSLAAKFVASSDPDGYTLFFGSAGSLVISPAIYRNAGYDPVTAFAPVAIVSNTPNILAVRPEVPVSNLQELIAYSKAHPGKLNYGVVLGTPPHLMLELFKLMSGADIFLIPYKGAAQAVTDVLSGETQTTMMAMPVILSAIQDGRLRALAITGAKRQPELPDVPTMAESGFPDFPSGSWQGIVTAAHTPPDIIRRLNQAINESLRSPELTASFTRLGAEAKIASPEEFGALIANESRKWQGVANAANIRID